MPISNEKSIDNREQANDVVHPVKKHTNKPAYYTGEEHWWVNWAAFQNLETEVLVVIITAQCKASYKVIVDRLGILASGQCGTSKAGDQE